MTRSKVLSLWAAASLGAAVLGGCGDNDNSLSESDQERCDELLLEANIYAPAVDMNTYDGQEAIRNLEPILEESKELGCE